MPKHFQSPMMNRRNAKNRFNQMHTTFYITYTNCDDGKQWVFITKITFKSIYPVLYVLCIIVSLPLMSLWMACDLNMIQTHFRFIQFSFVNVQAVFVCLIFISFSIFINCVDYSIKFLYIQFVKKCYKNGEDTPTWLKPFDWCFTL